MKGKREGEKQIKGKRGKVRGKMEERERNKGRGRERER